MTADFVRLEVADGVATLRLDRPKMNAISFQVQAELRAAAEQEMPEPARCLDVRGIGYDGRQRDCHIASVAASGVTRLAARRYSRR